ARGAADFTPYSPDEVEERLRRLPFGRLGKTEDVVGPAIFLATADSDWVTGDVLYADGGYTSAAATGNRHRPSQVPCQGDSRVSGGARRGHGLCNSQRNAWGGL